MVKSEIILLHFYISDEIHCIVYFPVDIHIHDLSYLTYFFKYGLFTGAWAAVHVGRVVLKVDLLEKFSFNCHKFWAIVGCLGHVRPQAFRTIDKSRDVAYGLCLFMGHGSTGLLLVLCIGSDLELKFGREVPITQVLTDFCLLTLWWKASLLPNIKRELLTAS